MGLETQSAKVPQGTEQLIPLADGLSLESNLDERSHLHSGNHSEKWKEEALTSLHLFRAAHKALPYNGVVQLALADDIDLPREEKPEKDVPKENEKVEKLTYAVREIDHDGKKIRVQVNTEGERKTYIVGGRSYQLAGGDGRFCIPVGTKGAPYHGPVKLHVLTESAKDLAALQSVLIPFLMNKKGIDWKTIDPNYGIGIGDNPEINKNIGSGQNAKAFTIYTTDIASATWLQTELDKVITNNGLALAQKSFETTDEISGNSNRVGLVREKFIPYTSTNKQPQFFKQPGFLLDAVLERLLTEEFRTKFGLTEGQEFTPGQLNQIELATGLREDSLTYGTPSSQRNGRRALMIVASEFSEKQPAYAPEGNKEIGDLTNRTALYALAKRYGVDQIDLARSEIQIETSLPAGQEITIGRRHQTIADDTYFPVNDDYVKVGRNEDGSWYLQDLGSGSKFKTFIKQRGVSETLQPNQKITITPEAKITFSEGLQLVFVPVVNPSGLHSNNIEGAKDSTKAKNALMELDRKTEKLDLSNLSHKEYADLNNEDIRYLVAHFPELKDVDLSGKQVIDDKSLFQIGYIKHLQSLGLNSTGTTDGDLAFLGDCSELQSLGLNGTAIRDAGLTAVGKFTKLSDLGLNHTAITDSGLASLNHLNNLRSLDLSYTSITNDGLAQVARLKNLERLDLRGVNLTDSGLQHLQTIGSLNSLYLDGNNLSTSALAELRKSLPHCLISLDKRLHSNTDYRLLNDSLFANQLEGKFDNSDITDEGLLFLSDPKDNLFGLYLANTNISDQGLKNLGQKPDLICLDLSGTNITNDGIKSVRDFKKIQSLLLANTSLTDDCMQNICHMKQLEVLVLGNTDITDTGLKDIHRLSNLKLLRIEGTNVTAAGLEQVKKLPNLVELHIDDSKMTREEIEAFRKGVSFCVDTNYDKLKRDEANKNLTQLPELWTEVKLADSLEDRTKLDINTSPLSSLAEVNSFSQEFITRWNKESETTDMEELNLHVKEIGGKLHKAQKVQEERLKQESTKVKDELHLDEAEATKVAEERLSNDPEWIRLNQEIDKLSAEHQTSIEPFERVVGAIDTTVRRLKMPEIKYQFYNMPDDYEAAGGCVPGTGKIFINANSYKLASESALAKTAYHELVHAEQDVLVIRAIADQVLGDKDLSKDETIKAKQITQIRDIYYQSTKDAVQLKNIPLKLDWALRVLETRSLDKTKLLSPQEKERVAVVMKGQNEYESYNFGLLKEEFRYVNKKIDDLREKGMFGAHMLLDDLLSAERGKRISQKLFGAEKPPEQFEKVLLGLEKIWVEKRAQGEKVSQITWPDDESQSVLVNALVQRLNNINNERERAARKYYDNAMEKEAQIIGKSVYARIEKLR